MNINILTNIIAGLILFLSVFYVLLAFPAVDYFRSFWLSFFQFVYRVFAVSNSTFVRRPSTDGEVWTGRDNSSLLLPPLFLI